MPRNCTCVGSCRGAAGLGPGWVCALEAEVIKTTASSPDEELDRQDVLTALRRAWEAGFRLCRSYGDNHAHFDGEQKERQWAAFLQTTGEPGTLAAVDPVGGEGTEGPRATDRELRTRPKSSWELRAEAAEARCAALEAALAELRATALAELGGIEADLEKQIAEAQAPALEPTGQTPKANTKQP